MKMAEKNNNQKRQNAFWDIRVRKNKQIKRFKILKMTFRYHQSEFR